MKTFRYSVKYVTIAVIFIRIEYDWLIIFLYFDNSQFVYIIHVRTYKLIFFVLWHPFTKLEGQGFKFRHKLDYIVLCEPCYVFQ